MRKTILVVSAFLSLLIHLVPEITAYAADLPARMTFATLPTGTSNNAMANALAKIASEKTGSLVVTRPGSSASAWVGGTNSSGQPELGFAHILDVWWAYSGKNSPAPLPGNPYGEKPFYPPNPNLRMLIAGPSQWVGVLARAEQPWKTLGDARGHSLAGGFSAHAGAYSSLVAALAAENLQESKDFKLVPVPSAGASVTALAEGRAELCLGSVGMSGVSEANASNPVRYLNVPNDPDSVARVRQAFPGSAVALYTGRAAGLTQDTYLITYPMIVTASTHMNDDTAYALVKAWWENSASAQDMHVAFKSWGPDNFIIKTATIPYHNGAIKFFKEKGVWSVQMETIQAALLKGEYPFLNE